MRQEEIVDEIRKKCGNVKTLPLIGWHFTYHGRYFVYLSGRNEEMVRFCIPYLTKSDKYEAKVVSEAINETNRNVKYIKAVKQGSGNISLGYDRKTTSNDIAESIVPHIIDALDFASIYFLNKLEGHETVYINNNHIGWASASRSTE